MTTIRLCAAAALVCGWLGCSPADGTGTLRIRVSGEGAAKQGYPFVKNNETIAFADGWQVSFTKFLVSLSNIRVSRFDGTIAADLAQSMVADIHLGDPQVAELTGLDIGRWDKFSFNVAPPQMPAVPLNAVAPADIDLMRTQGLNFIIEGSATKGPLAYTFSWGLRNPTRNANCTNGLDGTDGFVVKTNGLTIAEITIHVDHLFWDTLGTERAQLRFDAVAGASVDDTHITFDELGSQPLIDPRGTSGTPVLDAQGKAITYNPGSVPLDSNSLAGFMRASSASQAHVNGTGLCTVTRL